MFKNNLFSIRNRFLWISMIFVVSLIFSRFMVSVSMLLLLIIAVLEGRKQSSLSIVSFIKDKRFASLVLVFIVILLSGFNSSDTQEWLHQVKLKLPFLFLPFAFYVLKPKEYENHIVIHILLSIVVTLSGIGVLYNFWNDYEAIQINIGKGQAVPTPIDHIHYSIIIAYACVSSFLYLLIDRRKVVKPMSAALSLFLFALLHILSVRTGIVLSYVGIFIALSWYIINKKRYLVGIAAVVTLALLPFIAYKTVGPFKKKIDYMVWDIKQYQQGIGNNYSDSERLMSYKIASALIKEKPLFGHGIGDLKPLMIEKNKELYGQKEKYIYPHNQYLYILCTVGILGSIIFFIGLFAPFIFTNERSIFLIVIFAMLALSCLVENTIQRAVITAFFLFFILLNLTGSTSRILPDQKD